MPFEWTSCTDDLPDADTTVDQWRNIDAMLCEPQPTHWSHPPEPPVP